MTPAMVRLLTAYRELHAALARAPTLKELAGKLRVRRQSALRTLDRLRFAGYEVPLSGVLVARETQAAAVPLPEREKADLMMLLRRADALVSRYGDDSDAEWASFRRDAAVYLGAS